MNKSSKKTKKTTQTFKKTPIILAAVIIFLLFLWMAIYWIGRGTFAIGDIPSTLSVSCPSVQEVGDNVVCDVLLTLNNNETVLGVKANYSFGDSLEYVSFGVNTECERTECFEPYAVLDEGFAIANLNGVTTNQLLGKLTVKLLDDNGHNGITLTNVELSDENDEIITLEPVTFNVKRRSDDATLTNISLSTGQLNETFSSERTEYTADVAYDVDHLTILIDKMDDEATLTGTGSIGEVDLHYGINEFVINVTSASGTNSKTYHLAIRRDYRFATEVYYYNADENYMYTGADNDNTIIANLELLDEGLSYNINNNTLEVKYGSDEVLASVNILSFSAPYYVSNHVMHIAGSLTYGSLLTAINSDTLSFKVYDADDMEITDTEVSIVDGYVLRVYYGTTLFDSFVLVQEYLSFDGSLIIDSNHGVIKRIQSGTTYGTLKSAITTTGVITVISHDGQAVTDSSIIKTGDKISIRLRNNEYVYALSVLGDLTGDGEIKVNDVSKLYRHLKARDIITAEEVLAAGNIVNDGEIKISDVSRLYRYIKGRITSLEVVE